MNDRDAIAVLNDLLSREQSQLAHRLHESTCFVGRMDVALADLLRKLVERSAENCAALTAAILQLGGSPGPRFGNINTAHLHFQQLHHVVPVLVEDIRLLIAAYRRGAERAVTSPLAAEAIGRVLARYEKVLGQLEAATPAGA